MTYRRKLSVFVVCLSSWVLPLHAVAQDEAAEVAEAGEARPQYLDLRYNEDFSSADAASTGDFFDPVKHMQLDEDWSLSLGGEFRFR